MPDETTKHWTDDEELLARFVLGRLDAGESAPLQQHLNDCTRCAEAVRAEQLIAAGIKRAGRGAMKDRLVTRIGQHRSYQFNWYQAVGIAATIVLLVTIAIRYDWFGGVEPQYAIREKSDSSARPQLETPAEKNAYVPASTDAAKSPERGGEPKSVAGAEAGLRKEVKKSDLDEIRVVVQEKDKRSEPVTMALGKGERAEEKKMQTALMSVAADAGDLWTQGTVIPLLVNRFADQAAKPPADAKALSVIAATRKTRFDTAAVRVTQRPVSALPAVQRISQRFDGVQTLMRQSPQGVNLTLYSDTLLSNQDLSQPRLEVVGEDSLVLHIGRKIIGYKTPRGWLLRAK
jgi:hypothetical protein